jgi:shikimate dehydrogenase
MGSSYHRAGVMGWPVKHSLSPRLHGYWLHEHNLKGSYDLMPVEAAGLAVALRRLAGQGIVGVNLTVPHKEAACAIVDNIDDTAKRIGAINLVVVEGGKLSGRNTDAYGFRENLAQAGFKHQKGMAFILGAGGAARAVIVALQEMGFTKIHLTNRTLDRAEKLAKEFATPKCKIEVVDWDAPRDLGKVELLVNTTSLGMQGQPELLFPLDTLPATATVTDIVYVPLQTELLKQAQDKGLKTVDGLGMLLHQAVPSFQAFYGVTPKVTPQLREFLLADRKEI